MDGQHIAMMRRFFYDLMLDAMSQARRYQSDYMREWYNGRASAFRNSLHALNTYTGTLPYFEHGNGD